MSNGDGDTDWDKIKVEEGEANFSSRVIMAMITTLKAAKEAGGLTQDDMVSLLQNWIKLSAHFQRGGGADRLKVGVVKDERTQALALAYSKGGLLADFKGDPKAKTIYQHFEDINNPNAPKPSAALYASLNNLMNYVLNEHEQQRRYAYSDAEGSFAVLYYNYRTKLAADPDSEQHFRNLVARLRNGHTIK
jgi:hypothetical protein